MHCAMWLSGMDVSRERSGSLTGSIHLYCSDYSLIVHVRCHIYLMAGMIEPDILVQQRITII